MICGLLGRKLGHSYSPQIHRELGSYEYRIFEKEPEELENFVRNGTYAGLNVTIPYKKDVIPFLDELSPAAKKMGSVNTIIRREDGSLFGHNTDYYGFTSLVHHSGISVSGKKVLVLGSGGTSNTAVRALEDLGATVVIISRSGQNHYGNLYLHGDASVIVNTTPVGMYPNTGTAPLNLKDFPRLEGVLDVIYNPARTQLLLDAEVLGLPHENGLWMLVAQAKEDAVKALKEEFEGYNGFIFTDYRGMTVSQITELRNSLRKNDAQFRVVKNRYAKIAFQNLGKTGAEDQMVGPTAVALAKGDESNVVAKALFEAIKNGAPMQVKGAIIDGEVMDGAKVEALSKLPTKLELIASLMGTMKAPVQKLAATLLAYVESKGGVPEEN